ncbi:MAG: peptidylprolyl isomerase [archaeon]|nr:peptidylprolyl isomerase [archaeon]
MKFLIALLLVSLLLFGCTQSTTNTSTGLVGIKETGDDSMNKNIVENGDTIQVDYTLKLDNGEEKDSSIARGQPLEFTIGVNPMIPGFVEAVIGMKLNEEKNVIVPPEKGYGLRNEEAVEKVSLEDLNKAGITPTVDMTIYKSNGQSGKVIGVNDENAIIDFNDELAGQNLNFWIKVVKITKATASTQTTTQ